MRTTFILFSEIDKNYVLILLRIYIHTEMMKEEKDRRRNTQKFAYKRKPNARHTHSTYTHVRTMTDSFSWEEMKIFRTWSVNAIAVKLITMSKKRVPIIQRDETIESVGARYWYESSRARCTNVKRMREKERNFAHIVTERERERDRAQQNHMLACCPCMYSLWVLFSRLCACVRFVFVVRRSLTTLFLSVWSSCMGISFGRTSDCVDFVYRLRVSLLVCARRDPAPLEAVVFRSFKRYNVCVRLTLFFIWFRIV